MAWDLEVNLPNNPGSLASLGEALGRARVNIEGVSGAAAGGEGRIHVLVEDGTAAEGVLSSADIEVVGSTEVVTLPFDDRPGELGTVARKVADTGTNISLIYITTDRRLVLGTDDNAAAKEAFGL